MSVCAVGNEYSLSGRRINMNKDILKGKWLEIKGRVQEKWGKLTGNHLGEFEGKNRKLLGLLQKKYGYIRDKARLEYQDSVELAEIVSRIREIMTEKKDVTAIAFVARFGQPLLAMKHKDPKTGKEKEHGNDTHRYFDSRLSRRTAHLASQ
jgi:uncharacterized protein YjbJ (UPF0337 family)